MSKVANSIKSSKLMQRLEKVIEENPTLINSLNELIKLNFPSQRDESWKYFDNNLLEKLIEEFKFPQSTEESFKSDFFVNPELILCDGYLKTNKLHEGIEVLKSPISTTSDDSFLIKLNEIFSENFTLVFSKEKVIAPLNITIQSSQAKSFINSQISFIVERGSKAIINIVCEGINDIEYVNNLVLNFKLQENSNLEVNFIQLESSQSIGIYNVFYDCEKSSTVKVNSYSLGGRNCILRQNIDLKAKSVDASFNGLYLAGKDQSLHQQLFINHNIERCTSHQLFKGIIAHNGVAEFTGQVKVSKNAILTDANQLNRNLLLSPQAKVHTRPQLLIDTDDVKCSHGATTGQLQADHIFYLRSRGLSEDKAKEVLTYGFAEEVIQKCTQDNIKRKLDECFSKFINK
jgi:Fe-S cluster assembly protein SufD